MFLSPQVARAQYDFEVAMRDVPAPVWSFSALVTRYGIEIDGRANEPGCFARSLASWWLPLMGDHSARFFNFGVACDYDDSDAGLIVGFLTADPFLVASILDGIPYQFSVGYGCDPEDPSGWGELYEITAVAPPREGKCPGTRVLSLPRLATAGELERVGWHERNPDGAPVHEADSSTLGQEQRARFGVRRGADSIADFWADEAARRGRTTP